MPRSLRVSPAISFASIVVLALLVPAAGAGSATPSTRHATAQSSDVKPAPYLRANASPTACAGASASAGAIDHAFPGGSQNPVCGSSKNDTLIVNDLGGAGTQIWAGAGNDTIDAKNGKIDYIWGQGGTDTATIDWCLPPYSGVHDTTTDVAHVKKVKTRCTGVTRSTKHVAAASAISYPYTEPLIDCTATPEGAFLVAVARDPAMRAVDVSPNVDWQTVAFSALLYSLNNADQWQLVRQGPWVWDHAPDAQLDDYSGNVWRPFGKPSLQNILFTSLAPGKYRVKIDYHWYAANGVPDHDTAVWASYHFDHFASASLGECDFPGPPPPDGQYTGTTDEGRAVSFSTGPIWSTTNREVGGTRLSNVKIQDSVSCTPAGLTSEEIDFVSTRYIQLNYDNTFAYAASASLTSKSRQNVTATYSITGKIDTSGNASGTVAISQLAYDEDGTHHTCTGKPHAWTAKVAS